MAVNSVHILVAIRRDSPPPTKQSSITQHELFGGRGPAFLDIHIYEEMEKTVLRVVPSASKLGSSVVRGGSAGSNLDLKTGSCVRNKQTDSTRPSGERVAVGMMAIQMH